MGPEGIRYKMMPGACPGALEGKQSSQAHSRSADKPPHNATAWLPRPPLTFTRSISSGMFTMACVSQLSRLLAKFRIAWVKAPVEDAGAGQGGQGAFWRGAQTTALTGDGPQHVRDEDLHQALVQHIVTALGPLQHGLELGEEHQTGPGQPFLCLVMPGGDTLNLQSRACVTPTCKGDPLQAPGTHTASGGASLGWLRLYLQKVFHSVSTSVNWRFTMTSTMACRDRTSRWGLGSMGLPAQGCIQGWPTHLLTHHLTALPHSVPGTGPGRP